MIPFKVARTCFSLQVYVIFPTRRKPKYDLLGPKKEKSRWNHPRNCPVQVWFLSFRCILKTGRDEGICILLFFFMYYSPAYYFISTSIYSHGLYNISTYLKGNSPLLSSLLGISFIPIFFYIILFFYLLPIAFELYIYIYIYLKLFITLLLSYNSHLFHSINALFTSKEKQVKQQ